MLSKLERTHMATKDNDDDDDDNHEHNLWAYRHNHNKHQHCCHRRFLIGKCQ